MKNGSWSDSEHNYWSQFDIPEVAHLSFVSIVLGISFLALISNLLIIVVYQRNPSLNPVVRFYIYLLSCKDIFVCCVLNALFAVNAFNSDWVLGSAGCVIFGFLDMYTISLEIGAIGMALVEIAWNVFNEVCPTSKHEGMSYWSTVLLVLNIYALFVSGPPLLGMGEYVLEGFQTVCSYEAFRDRKSFRMYLVYLFVVGVVIPGVVCVGSGIVMFKGPLGLLPVMTPEPLRRHLHASQTRRTQRQRRGRRSTGNTIADIQLHNAFQRSMIGAAVGFAAAFFPYTFFKYISHFGPEKWRVGPYLLMTTWLISKLSLLLRLPVFLIYDHNFRNKFVTSLPCFACLKRTDEESTYGEIVGEGARGEDGSTWVNNVIVSVGSSIPIQRFSVHAEILRGTLMGTIGALKNSLVAEEDATASTSNKPPGGLDRRNTTTHV